MEAPAAPTASGSIAYDSTNFRYAFGADLLTFVGVMSPLLDTGMVTNPTDVICSDPVAGCDNGVSSGLHSFQQHVNLPTAFFASAGKTVRLTCNLAVATSSSSVPTVQVALTYTSTTTATTPLFESAALSPPAGLGMQQVAVTCTVTSKGAASATAVLYATCISGTVGTVVVSSTTIPVPLLSSNTITSSPTTVDTTSAGEALDLGISYGSNVAGNTVTLLNVTPEFVQ